MHVSVSVVAETSSHERALGPAVSFEMRGVLKTTAASLCRLSPSPQATKRASQRLPAELRAGSRGCRREADFRLQGPIKARSCKTFGRLSQ